MTILSIIIPSFNYGNYIGDCLESLRHNKSDAIEVLLVDGGSTDNTMSIAALYDDVLDLVVSESDEGQSDAIDKGIGLSKGKYVTWLNADDVLFPGAIAVILETIKKLNSKRWFAGSSMWLNKDLTFNRVAVNSGWSSHLNKMGMISVYGPSSIFSREMYHEVGGIDCGLSYCMDRDLWCRFNAIGERYVTIPAFLFGLRLHEAAKVSGPGVIGGDIKMSPQYQAYQTESAIISEKYGAEHYSRLMTFCRKRLYRSGRLAPLKTAYFNSVLRGKSFQQLSKSPFLSLV